ncbi:MAG: hypothetical protein CMJ77_10495 [Planctomycetaceae bacterium]|nr:hypothetical protein [Planctomycetaceae bacterium]MBM99545.1 hypothetical protein [Planctomycetaceae bacterium]
MVRGFSLGKLESCYVRSISESISSLCFALSYGTSQRAKDIATKIALEIVDFQYGGQALGRSLGNSIADLLELGVDYAEKLLTDVIPDKFARLGSPGGSPIQSNHAAFIYGHLMLHLGQMNAWRRMMGLSPA